jgi:hypothetical protein
MISFCLELRVRIAHRMAMVLGADARKRRRPGAVFLHVLAAGIAK